jgi:YbgC/YbaW family acyl-CoA thioester hydrolase
MSAIHRIELPVEWGDIDAAGIVFYPNYFRWFDHAAHALLRKLDCAPADLLRRGYVVPLIEAASRFLLPVVYGDQLVIESTVVEIRTRAFRLRHQVLRGPDVVAEGNEVRVWARAGTGSPPTLDLEAIPDDVRARLQA